MAILLRVVIRAARNTSNTSNSALEEVVWGNNILFVIRSEEQDEQILHGLAYQKTQLMCNLWTKLHEKQQQQIFWLISYK